VCTSDLSTLLRIELLGRQSPALSTGRLPHSHKTVLFFPTINRIRGAIRLGDPLPWTRSTARPLTGTPEGPPATAGPCRPAARAPRLPPLAAAALPPLLVYYRYSILGGGPSRALPLLLQTAASSGSASQGEREAAAAPYWHWQRYYNGSVPRTPYSVDHDRESSSREDTTTTVYYGAVSGCGLREEAGISPPVTCTLPRKGP
jgi:hypothetical protein